jgi:hypothetical protein
MADFKTDNLEGEDTFKIDDRIASSFVCLFVVVVVVVFQ